MITVAELEKHCELPAAKWAGNCYGIACKAAELIDGAVAVYGHYLGEVADGTMFAPVAFFGFVQHGWVQMSNGDVVDPTRWAFEGVEPYIYNGPADNYDEGGIKLRGSLMGPPPDFDDEGVHAITDRVLPEAAWKVVERLLKLDEQYAGGVEPGVLCVKQLIWLANCDPRSMGGQATAIYAMFKRFKLQGFIPLDNRRMVERTPM